MQNFAKAESESITSKSILFKKIPFSRNVNLKVTGPIEMMVKLGTYYLKY